jgi:hypothetical protein
MVFLSFLIHVENHVTRTKQFLTYLNDKVDELDDNMHLSDKSVIKIKAESLKQSSDSADFLLREIQASLMLLAKEKVENVLQGILVDI